MKRIVIAVLVIGSWLKAATQRDAARLASRRLASQPRLTPAERSELLDELRALLTRM